MSTSLQLPSPVSSSTPEHAFDSERESVQTTRNSRAIAHARLLRGMRVTVSAVVGQLAAGRTADEVLADYPNLEREDIFAALEYAAAAVSERELPTPAA